MIVLDASVLIAYLDAEDGQHGAAESVLEDVVDESLAANPLTLAEVLVGPARTGRLDAARAVLEELEVREVSLPVAAATALAQLRADTGLRLPDCCVLLTAQQTRAAVATFDRRLGHEARRLGHPVLPLS